MKNYSEQLKTFDQLTALVPEIERKGKTMPYTSANGHMFSQLNKAGEIGIRLSEEDGKQFIEEFNTTIFKSYGAVMKGYVLIPDEMLRDLALVATYLKKAHEYVMSLEPK